MYLLAIDEREISKMYIALFSVLIFLLKSSNIQKKHLTVKQFYRKKKCWKAKIHTFLLTNNSWKPFIFIEHRIIVLDDSYAYLYLK